MGSANAYNSGVPPFSAGDKLSAAALEKMREADQRALPQRGVGSLVRQTPGGTIVTPVQRRRSSSPHPFRVFDASDAEGLKVMVHYGAVVEVSNPRAPEMIEAEIDGLGLIPDPQTGERPKLALPEDGETVWILLELQIDESGQLEFPQSESDPSPVTIIAVADEDLADTFSQANRVFTQIARIEIGESEGANPVRILRRIDQILGSHFLWPQKATHPFQVFDASDQEGPAVSVAYGAVIDMTRWQNPELRVPTLSGESLPTSIFGEMPKFSVDSGESFLCLVIEQGEAGEIASAESSVRIESFAELPDDTEATLYVRIARLNASSGSGGSSVRITQILGSHVVWPFKPDFAGWRQKNDSEASALWLGSGSNYNSDIDDLSDLFIEVNREDFDNGRDGNRVFGLRMKEDENFELTFDRDNQRGFDLLMTEQLTRLYLDRKGTASAGISMRSSDDEASMGQTGPGDGGSGISARTDENTASMTVEAEQSAEIKVEIDGAEILIRSSGDDPQIELSGQGTVRIRTIDGKEIEMREVTYMEDMDTQKTAYFLCSEPEGDDDDYEPGQHHSGHDGHGSHGNHHAGHAPGDHDDGGGDDGGGGYNPGAHHAGHNDPYHDYNPAGHHMDHDDYDPSEHHLFHNDPDHDGGGDYHHSNHHSPHVP